MENSTKLIGIVLLYSLLSTMVFVFKPNWANIKSLDVHKNDQTQNAADGLELSKDTFYVEILPIMDNCTAKSQMGTVIVYKNNLIVAELVNIDSFNLKCANKVFTKLIAY